MRPRRREFKMLHAGGGAGSLTARDAIPTECIGDGWYRVELAEFAATYDTDIGLGSAAVGSAACDLCTEVDLGAVGSAGITGDCETAAAVSIARPLPTGTGSYVYAHDCETVPLEIGGHCRIIRMRAAAGAGSVGSGGASGYYWAIVSGKRKMAKLPFPVYECCTDPVTGVETVQLTSCTYVIAPGVPCDGGSNPCPVGSV